MQHTLMARSIAVALLVATGAAAAQQGGDGKASRELDKIIVQGEITYRDRTDEASTLVYDLEYFQRFEPLTVGDMLKRVPSVAFLSDVLEYDGVRLRGLDPGYTQILINGKRVPGGESDRSFFVDRIPAELVDRIEIIRSASADRSGDAVAGSLNIVLRDGYALDGGYLRAGGLYYEDDRIEPSFSAVWGGEALGGQLLLGANAQGRRNPKQKFSQRFDEPGGELDNTEVQSDVRSGEDYSFNLDYSADLGAGQLGLNAFFVRTDRYQDEDSTEYVEGIQTPGNIDNVNANDEDIRTDNWSVGGEYEFPMAGGDTRIRLGFATFENDVFEFEDEFEYLRDDIPFPEDDRFTGDRTYTAIEDDEFNVEIRHTRDVGDNKLKFGVDYTQKERDTAIITQRNRFTIPDAPGARPTIPGTFDDFEAESGGINRINEDRIEPFVRLDGESGSIEWQVGLRYQYTDLEIFDATVDAQDARQDNSFGALLPSGSLIFNLDEDRRITLSAARTMRRANFNQLSPALLEGELGDNDLLGNPQLEPEDAWGIDLGYEVRLGRDGVIGINGFYRDIQDLIEIANTGLEGDEGPGTFVLQPRNTGDGEVWGVELDISTPLTAFGMENTGVFLNYSWLDSEITDFAGTRRFNDQSNYVYNIGFIQELPELAASFGVTYREQGDAYGRIVAEEVRTSYDGDLEAFVEKRLGDAWTVRLTGSNLLDASKDEIFDKFNTFEEQLGRDYDEFELETETGGRVYQLMFRYAF